MKMPHQERIVFVQGSTYSVPRYITRQSNGWAIRIQRGPSTSLYKKFDDQDYGNPAQSLVKAVNSLRRNISRIPAKPRRKSKLH